MKNEITLLRKFSDQQDMRKKLIGGISEEDVNKFINNMHQHFRDLQDEYNKHIQELDSSKSELSVEFDQYKLNTKKEIAELQKALEKATSDSSNYSTQCKEKDRIISQLEKSHASELNQLEPHHSKDLTKLADNIVALEKALKESNQLLEEEREKSKEVEQQLKNEYQAMIADLENQLKQRESAKSPNHDIHAIYTQLANVKEQVTIIENLQQKLELERYRAEKAESEIAQFRSWLHGVKDHFQKGKKELDTQLAGIQEKHKTMLTDVDAFYSNSANLQLETCMEIDRFFQDSEGKKG